MSGLSGVGRRLLSAAMLVGLAVGGFGVGTGAGQTAASPANAAPQPTIAEKIAASKELLDINTATAEELKALPGMGVVYVQRVIAGRPYSAKNQLVNRGILPEDEYLKIKDSIIAHRVKK